MTNPGRTARRARGRARGFTLVELMVVLFILGLLGTIVFQAVFPKVDEAKIKTTKIQMEALGVALDSYRLDVGRYPDQLQELVASSGQTWKGPYLKKKEVPRDAWGNDFLYEPVDNGTDYKLSSSGDGKEPIVNQ